MPSSPERRDRPERRRRRRARAKSRSIALITSANIACGGHAGDDATMREAVRLALRHGVAIGAHPSYPDRAKFGRVSMILPRPSLRAPIAAQIAALATGRGCSRRAS